MSIFRPFRNKNVIKAAVVLGGALKLSGAVAFAQQEQRVNIAKIDGQAPVPAICDNSTGITHFAIETNSSAGNVKLVEHTGGSTARIYVCGYDVKAGANAVDVQFVSGTSTDCSSNETDISGLYRMSSYGGFVRANAGSPQFVVTSSHSFCIELGSTGPVGGLLTYVQR